MNLETLVNSSTINYLNKRLLESDNKLKVLPAKTYKVLNSNHITKFCETHALSVLPTTELITFLKENIEDLSKTIQIQAGDGTLAKTLGINAFDNRNHDLPSIKEYYNNILKQPTINYGTNVIKLDSIEAIEKYKPDTVIASWTTHKYNQLQHFRGGDLRGIDESYIIRTIDKYILICDEHIHAKKPILNDPHFKIKPPWLITKSYNKNTGMMCIWRKGQQTNYPKG